MRGAKSQSSDDVFHRFTVVDHRGGLFTADVEASLEAGAFFRLADVGAEPERMTADLQAIFARCHSFVVCEAALATPAIIETRGDLSDLVKAIENVEQPGKPLVGIFTTMGRLPGWIAHVAYYAPGGADLAIVAADESRTICRVGAYFEREAA